MLAGPIAPKFDQTLREALRELGLTDKVDILGVVDHDQIPTLISTATICVVPAASDLTPNPAVVYPTKLLEHMACRRACVAPRRETVQMVVENGREALLFEAGDPIDLAKKCLRLLGEPLLRERIATAGYDRVRRDFTASASRRAMRNAYDVIAQRFASQFGDDQADENPKVEMLSDDDFEATVFEEPVAAGGSVDTSVSGIMALDDSLVVLDDGSNVEGLAPPPSPDETMERKPVPPRVTDRIGFGASPEPIPSRDSGAWTHLHPAPSPTGPDDWVVTNVAAAARKLVPGVVVEHDTGDSSDSGVVPPPDDGTPIEGVAGPAPPVVEGTFVAGEIDVPTPGPSQSVDFTAAGGLLGTASSEDKDTGNVTPPIIERR